MLEHDLFPDEAMDETRVKEYWKHLESTKLAWACQHVDRYGYGFVPLFLWGDDAQFSEDRKEKKLQPWPLVRYLMIEDLL